jgi:hypothetical protein
MVADSVGKIKVYNYAENSQSKNRLIFWPPLYDGTDTTLSGKNFIEDDCICYLLPVVYDGTDTTLSVKN